MTVDPGRRRSARLVLEPQQMAIDFSFDTAEHLACVRATGDCDMVDTLAAMYRLAFDFRFKGITGILVDLRDATARLRADETYALAAQQARADMFASQRIALLVRPESPTVQTAQDMRRFAPPAGPGVEVFTDEDAARAWASSRP